MDDWKKTLRHQVNFEIKEKEVATIVVNGVAQESRKVQYVVITCPTCGVDLLSFPEGVQLVDIYKELATQSPIENFQGHCQVCGTRLMCDKSIVDEQIVNLD